jgi:hypothetical protein
MKKLENGHALRYLGAEKRRRAKEGVGIIMDDTTDKNVIKWTPHKLENYQSGSRSRS